MAKPAKKPETCSHCGDPIEGHPSPRPCCRYNGWTNYETWLVGLWIDNDQGSHLYWREAAQEIWDDATPGQYEWQTRDQQAAYALAKRLKDEIDDGERPLSEDASLYSDLLNAALSEVNWDEIASGMLDDVDKSDDGEEA